MLESGKIVAINDKVKSSGGKAQLVRNEINFNPDMIVLEATTTGTKEFAFETANGATMIVKTPVGTYQGDTVSFNATIGDKVYIYPNSGNWQDLKKFDSVYKRVRDWQIDLAREADRMKHCHTIRMKFLVVLNPDITCFGSFADLTTLEIQNSTSITTWSGSVANISHVSYKLNAHGCWDLSGNISDLNANLQHLSLQSELITGDSVHFRSLYLQSAIHLSFPAATMRLSDLSHLIIASLYEAQNVTGDISAMTTNIAAGIFPSLSDATLITGSINVFSPISGYKFCKLYNCPNISGDLVSLNKTTRVVYFVATNIHQYTTASNSEGFGAITIDWYNSVTPIAEIDLVRLIADKRLYVENNTQLNGSMNIGGNNASITNTQALADIAYLESQGWTVTYNT